MFNNKSVIGFSRSVDDYRKKDFDLSQLIMPNKNASFILTMSSNKFSSFGIYQGDNLIVDKTLVVSKINKNSKYSYVVIEEDGIMKLTTTKELAQRDKTNCQITVWGCVRTLVRKMPY